MPCGMKVGDNKVAPVYYGRIRLSVWNRDPIWKPTFAGCAGKRASPLGVSIMLVFAAQPKQKSGFPSTSCRGGFRLCPRHHVGARIFTFSSRRLIHVQPDYDVKAFLRLEAFGKSFYHSPVKVLWIGLATNHLRSMQAAVNPNVLVRIVADLTSSMIHVVSRIYCRKAGFQ